MSSPLVLLVTEDGSLSDVIKRVTESIGNLTLAVVPNLHEGWRRIEAEAVTLVIAHLNGSIPFESARQFLEKIKGTSKTISTLFISEKNHPEQSLILFRSGIVDNLPRPLCLNRLTYLIDMVTVRARVVAHEHQPHQSRERSVTGGPFVYEPTEPMGQLMEQIRKVAPLNTTVLLQGETGTGKTRVARLIHELSGRQQHPFLVVNCGSLSANLIESELFGHVKGAFTSAYENHGGKFAEVGRGTLLLDDIDTLSLELQCKLLRVVEARLFEPVGSNKSQRMLGRLIVASNRDLREYMAAGRFRNDLYYRLNVIGFYLPPLRDRPSLIPSLVRQFLHDHAATNGLAVRRISPAALRALEEHDWPGNIRELQNALEQALALCDGEEIQPTDLSGALRQRTAEPIDDTAFVTSGTSVEQMQSLAKIREQSEFASISEALVRFDNNRLRVASELGISRMTLYKKLRKYGLHRSRQKNKWG